MEAKKEFRHISVLFEETVDALLIRPGGVYVDGTLGGAGHAYEICKRMQGRGRFVGIDQDEDAIAAARERLLEFPFAEAVRSNYEAMADVLHSRGIDKADGILLDLGVSSYQLDTEERGFSYKTDAPLDMRMDNRMEKTAKDIVNGYSEQELYRIIRDYGEDQFAKNIAKHIVRMREEKPIETTYGLVEAVKAAIPAKMRKGTGHPAKKTFQAVRIELNRELEVLTAALDSMVSLLAPGGRLAIITFHSLEDRIVKLKFRENEHPCTCPPDFPICVCGRKSRGMAITKKPVTPSAAELEFNPRSKSAKLRVFEKTKAWTS